MASVLLRPVGALGNRRSEGSRKKVLARRTESDRGGIPG